MKGKYVLIPLLVGVVAIAFAPVVGEGSIAKNIIAWEDTDYEAVYDTPDLTDPNNPILNTINEGDVFVGMWQIQKAGPANPTVGPRAATEDFTAVFALEVASVDPGGGEFGSDRITYRPLPFVDSNADTFDDNWLDDFGLIRTDADTLAVFYHDTDGILSDVEVDGVPSDGPPAAPASVLLPNIWQELQTAQNMTKLWEVGFPTGVEEFWTADVNSLLLPPPLGVLSLDYVASMNVTVGDPSGLLVAHTYYSTIPFPPPPTGAKPTLWSSMEGVHDADADGLIMSQWQLHGGLGSLSTDDFEVNTDTDIFYAVIPEPASVLVWGLLGVAAAVGGLWRRRSST